MKNEKPIPIRRRIKCKKQGKKRQTRQESVPMKTALKIEQDYD